MQVLEDDEVKQIEEEKGLDKSTRIISCLRLKPDAVYPLFIKSLHESNQGDIADMLEAGESELSHGWSYIFVKYNAMYHPVSW